MLEYLLDIATTSEGLFYGGILIAVLLEGPMVVLSLTILAGKLNLGFWFLFFLSLFGDFGGDLLHFLLGRYGNKLLKYRKLIPKPEKLSQLNEKIKNYPLLEKLIIIKYTPPITTLGLIYLGSTDLQITDFIRNTLPLCTISSLMVLSFGYWFSAFLGEDFPLWWLLLCLWIALFTLVKSIRFLSQYIIKLIEKKNKKNQTF